MWCQLVSLQDVQRTLQGVGYHKPPCDVALSSSFNTNWTFLTTELEVVAEVVAGLEEVAWLEVAGFEVAGLVDM